MLLLLAEALSLSPLATTLGLLRGLMEIGVRPGLEGCTRLVLGLVVVVVVVVVPGVGEGSLGTERGAGRGGDALVGRRLGTEMDARISESRCIMPPGEAAPGAELPAAQFIKLGPESAANPSTSAVCAPGTVALAAAPPAAPPTAPPTARGVSTGAADGAAGWVGGGVAGGAGVAAFIMTCLAATSSCSSADARDWGSGRGLEGAPLVLNAGLAMTGGKGEGWAGLLL